MSTYSANFNKGSFEETVEKTVVPKTGTSHHAPTQAEKIDATKSGGMAYQGFNDVKKVEIAKAGTEFKGETKVDQTDYTRSGDKPLNNFPCQSTAVPKKGTPWVPKNQRVAVEASGQAYNAFPTESTDVKKAGSAFAGETTVNKIDDKHTGGMMYQGIEGVGKK